MPAMCRPSDGIGRTGDSGRGGFGDLSKFIERTGGDCIRKNWIAGGLSLLLLLGMCGCGRKTTSAQLTGMILERGHGSMWGNQFYIDVCPTQINQIRFFSPDDPGGELLLRENIPISPEDWEEIVAAVNTLTPNLQKEKRQKESSLMLDGGAFYKLTLMWDGEATTYRWPEDEAATKLERILENFINIMEV